jgi:cell division protein FtsB
VAKRTRKPPRSRFVLRWLAVGAIVLVGLLYARPLRSYLDAKHDLARRATDVRTLKAERRALQHRLAESTSPQALTQQARRLGLVRPGERLFVISKESIEAWLRNKATIERGGR